MTRTLTFLLCEGEENERNMILNFEPCYMFNSTLFMNALPCMFHEGVYVSRVVPPQIRAINITEHEVSCFLYIHHLHSSHFD